MELISTISGFLGKKIAEKVLGELFDYAFGSKCQVSGCGDKANYETPCCEEGICDFHIALNIKKKKNKFVCPICGRKTGL